MTKLRNVRFADNSRISNKFQKDFKEFTIVCQLSAKLKDVKNMGRSNLLKII